MFLRNHWYVAATDKEIGAKPFGRILLGEPVVMYRAEDGTIIALEDRCPHRRLPLSMGKLIGGDVLQCHYHGLRFDRTGACVRVPGQDAIPANARVKTYPVVERYHWVWIWMGDVEKADPNLIVDYPPLADPKWRGLPGYMHYKANWLLIVDNLSDFVHLAFVHTKTLGGTEEYAFKTRPVAIERLDNGFRVERWHMNAPPPPETTYSILRPPPTSTG